MKQTRAETGGGGSRAAHYAALLSEQEISGMSVRAFALARGLSPLNLYVWRRKLGRTRRRGGGVLSGGLVAVDVIERGGGGALIPSGFEVSLANGHRVHVPERFDSAGLAQLLTVLRAC